MPDLARARRDLKARRALAVVERHFSRVLDVPSDLVHTLNRTMATPAQGTIRDVPTSVGGLGGEAALAVLALGLERAVALGIALYLPRHLGLADYGHYAFVLSFLGFFQALPDASLEAVLVARVARAGDGGAAVAVRGAIVRGVVSLVGGTIALALLALVTRDRALVGAAAVAAAGFLAGAATPFRVQLRASGRLGRYLALLAAQAGFGIVLVTLVVRAGGGLVLVLGANALAAAAAIGVGRLLAGCLGRPAHTHLARALLADAWPLAGGTLLLLGGQQLVLLLLLRLHGAAAMGLYGSAQKLVEAVGLLPQALMLSVLPALARVAATPGAASAGAREAARVLVVVLVPAVAVLVLWAEPVLGRLFGPSFAAAAPVLRVLAPAALLGATGLVLTNLLVAVGLQRALLAATGGSALVLVALGTALVPAQAGPGAAAAFAAAMVCGQVALLAIGQTRATVAPVLAAVVRPLALGALVAAGVAALHVPPVVGATLLCVGYPAALLLTGTVTTADLGRWR